MTPAESCPKPLATSSARSNSRHSGGERTRWSSDCIRALTKTPRTARNTRRRVGRRRNCTGRADGLSRHRLGPRVSVYHAAATRPGVYAGPRYCPTGFAECTAVWVVLWVVGVLRRRRTRPFELEATPRIELGMEVLQTSALPLGYVATKLECRFYRRGLRPLG